MTGRWFLDTNVAVYAFDDDEPDKQRIALDLLDSEQTQPIVVSTQVLGEFYVTVTRKLGLPADVARVAVADLSRYPVVPTDAKLVLAAVDTARRDQVSYWDALIIEAAATARCQRVLSEDLNDGQAIRGVTIVNPFARPAG